MNRYDIQIKECQNLLKMIRRGFPSHMSRTVHPIRILCLHECSDICKYKTIQTLDDDLNITLSLAPSTERCPHKGSPSPGQIRLSSFSSKDPQCLNGPLLQPNTLIIREPEISICIDHPLSTPCIQTLYAPSPEGFRLSSLLESIKLLYQRIYAEELETASEKTHTLTLPCNKCTWNPVSSTPCNASEEDCSICCSQLDSDVCSTNCNHIFHSKCIVSWSRHGDKCPICREKLYKCEVCNGSRTMSVKWTGKVIPPEYRIFRPRNKTDGRWGIHTSDFEALVLTGMEYNRRDRMLYLEFSK